MNAFGFLVLVGLGVATAQIGVPWTGTIGHPIIGGYGTIGDIYNRGWLGWNTISPIEELYGCGCTKCCGCNNIYGGIFGGLGTFGKCDCGCCKHCTPYELGQLYHNCQCCGLPIGRCNCNCCKYSTISGFAGTYTPYNLWNPLFPTFHGRF